MNTPLTDKIDAEIALWRAMLAEAQNERARERCENILTGLSHARNIVFATELKLSDLESTLDETEGDPRLS